MKKTHILGLLVIALAIGTIMTSIAGSITYSDFDQAFANPEKEFQVKGELDREREMIYDPEVDPNKFIFYLKDNNGVSKKVILNQGKPQDFERSEEIVLIGKAGEDAFHARKILMKCPSKYNDGADDFKTPEELEKSYNEGR